MTITSQDLAFLQSEEMSDFGTGGGQATGHVIVDGEMNNVFPDKYSLSLVYGNVSLRKVFAAVRTVLADVYGGARVFLSRGPTDPNVYAALFSTGSYTDHRPQIQQYVESYLAPSVISKMRLLGTQLQNQGSIIVYGPITLELPDINSVWQLSYEPNGVQSDYQYVRVKEIIGNEVREFEDSSGIYTRRVLTLALWSRLKRMFPGAEASRGVDTATTKVRETLPNSSAEFYGLSKLTQAADQGDYSVKVESILVPVVPSAQAETPITDAQAGLTLASMVQSGTVAMTLSRSVNYATGQSYTLYFPRAFMPGSLSLALSGVNYKEGSNGDIVKTDGSYGTLQGTVVYSGGSLVLSVTAPINGTLTASAMPAAAIPAPAFSAALAITLSNQASNYTFNLQPLPAKGAVQVDYMSGGRWYRITDNGQGLFVGEGSGSINYATGSGVASLLRQPDPGSSVIWTWGQGAPYHSVAEAVIATKADIRDTLSFSGSFKPGSLSMAWTAGGQAKTATDSNGAWTGDATGSIRYGQRQFDFRPSVLADSDTDYTLTYQTAAATTDTVTANVASHQVSATLSGAGPIVAGTASFVWADTTAAVTIRTRRAKDDGAGNLVADDPWASGNIGTIDYNTRAIVLTVEQEVTYRVFTGGGLPEYWGTTTMQPPAGYGAWTDQTSYTTYADDSLQAWYLIDATQTGSDTEIYTAPDLTIDLSADWMEPFVPGSLRFTLGSHTYIDRDGVLYADVDPDTGNGTAAGTLDYDSHLATITYYGGANALTVHEALSTYALGTVIEVFSRAAGAPLRPGSFFIRALRDSDGALITATADNDGVIAGTDITGTVDVQTGIFKVRFRNGSTQVPVRSNSIFYNAVAYAAIPLDSDVLGLDPTQLPIDGKVPIFIAGRVIMVHETFTQAIAQNPPTADLVVTLNHDKIGKAHVIDANGNKVLEGDTTYAVGKEAGTVTFANPVDLSGFTGPYSVIYRIQDELLCLDASLDGTVKTNKALSRDYSTDAYVSSEMLIDDQQARVTTVFAQNTWSGAWSDSRIGDPPSQGAQFNHVLYPVTVGNKGAVTERWRAHFVTPTTVDIIGEYFGVVLEDASILQAIHVPNPAAPGYYYMSIPAAGWGGSWIAGNQLRLNTQAANYPVDVLRCIQPGEPGEETDSVTVELLGDAN